MARRTTLIVAAGTGSRMAHTLPKQYLPLCGEPLLAYSVRLFCNHPAIDEVLVVLNPEDDRFAQYDWSACAPKLTPAYCGGATRAHSVLNGLRELAGRAKDDDWVLVHDAARPCLTRELVDRLVSELENDAVGGLLAIPVADTLKRDDGNGRSARTEPREGLWQAQTPQMFRHGLLLRALEQAALARVTDEASAVEQLGLRPRLVPGSLANLKVTYAADLDLAAAILQTHPGEARPAPTHSIK
jgi:2-C-methyl-D-erythritol 4-phosphate cytidylyltransferase